MKKRIFKNIIIVGVVALLLWRLLDVMSLVIIKHAGKKVTATITKIPAECDRYNHINVLLNNQEYEVKINKADCTESLYKTGQQVQLLKHKNFKQLIWPGSHPEIALALIVVVAIYSYTLARNRYRKTTAHVENRH